jgi:hypothetical protein
MCYPKPSIHAKITSGRHAQECKLQLHVADGPEQQYLHFVLPICSICVLDVLFTLPVHQAGTAVVHCNRA